MGKAVFQGSADSKPLTDQYRILKKYYPPNIMLQTNFHNNRLPNMAQLQLIVCPFFVSFHFLSQPFSGTLRSISMLDTSNNVVYDKELPFGGLAK
jgi:hypothetical protein